MLSLSSRSKPIIHHDFCEVKEINPIGKRETNENPWLDWDLFLLPAEILSFQISLVGYVSSPHLIIREGAGWREHGEKKKRYSTRTATHKA
jgi:hypothetical protein